MKTPSSYYSLNARGFTLVELMITLVIGSFISAGVLMAFTSQNKSYISQGQVAQMQQNLRAGMALMTTELRMAGYDPNGSAGATITYADSTTLSFTIVADSDGVDNNNVSGPDETDELKTVTYSFYDASGDGINDTIGRQEPNAPPPGNTRTPLIENVEQVEFYYTLADGITPSPTLSPANPADIRSIQVSVLIRTERRDRDFTNNDTYFHPGGIAWGSYADNYRRRLLSTNINCRNMGL